MFGHQALAHHGIHLDRRRIGGSAAAAGVLLGLPVIPAVLMGGPYALLAIPVFAGVVALGAVAVRLLWDHLPLLAALRQLLAAAVLAAIAVPIAWLTLYAITVTHDLCGYSDRGQFDPAVILFAVGYLGTGLWGFQRPKRLLWAWPLAVVVGFGLALVVTAVLPGAHGFCET